MLKRLRARRSSTIVALIIKAIIINKALMKATAHTTPQASGHPSA